MGQIIWALLIIWLLPNSQTLLRHYEVCTTPVERTSRIAFRPNWLTLGMVLLVLIYSFSRLTQLSEFLYFRF